MLYTKGISGDLGFLSENNLFSPLLHETFREIGLFTLLKQKIVNFDCRKIQNHVDIPVTIGGKTIHVLMAHPTPPGFDGEEDRIGKRNHDEIRLIADYISPEKGDYLYDDQGEPASLSHNSSFVIMGDMNADPQAGSSYQNAIDLLLEHPSVHPEPANGNMVPSSEGSKIWHEQKPNDSHPAHKTAIFNLRVDYVLPSADLQPVKSGVFWPAPSDSLFYLTTGDEGSDHRLVWVDVAW